MKLSIIIPVYNAAKFLKECMDSIVLEINDQIEVLLLDDGSQDKSYELIKNYENSQIRVFHHENHGVSYTRNRGIQEAQGDYIMFVDADDKLCSGWCQVVMQAIKKRSNIIYFGQSACVLPKKEDIIYGIFGIRTSKWGGT